MDYQLTVTVICSEESTAMKTKINFLPKLFFLVTALSQPLFLFSDNCNKRCATSSCTTDSKTFFKPRSIIEDVSLFFGLNQYNYYRKYLEPCEPNDNYYDNRKTHLAVGIFFEKSHLTKNNNFGKFFFSGDADTEISSDSNASESILTVSPVRKVVGAYLDYHQEFCFCDNLWFELKAAVYKAMHNLHAKECVVSEITEDTCTPLSYLSSSLLKFGRIPTTQLSKTGIDDIEIKIGYNYNCYDRGYIGLYASGLFPTADKPKACFLFEPLVGRGHWGVGGGLDAAYTFYRCENSSWALLTDLSYQHLFKGNELRSLDLIQGQLTRFMAANTETNTGQSVPVINLTTLNLNVEPRGMVNFWLASHLQRCRWHLEAG